MKVFAFLMSLSLIAVAEAPKQQAVQKRLMLHAEAEITIKKYVEAADAFIIIHNAEPSVGPNYVTPEALKKAIGIEGTMKEFRDKIASLIGSVYVLKGDLPFLWEKEFNARKKSKKD